MRIPRNEGRERTRELFPEVLSCVVFIVVPLVFGFMTVRKDLISVHASERYVEAHRIISYVIIGKTV